MSSNANKTFLKDLKKVNRGERELFFNPSTGELIVGRQDEPRTPDNTVVTEVAREGFAA